MKKLALVTDVRNWAFHNIASHIENFLGNEFDIRILFTEDYDEQSFDLYKEAYLEFGADIVHYFWREQFFALWRNPMGIQRRMLASGVDIDEFTRAYGTCINTSTVYDHMHGDVEALAERRPLFELLDGYSVASPILRSLYSDHLSTPPNNITEDGIDPALFYPQNLERFADHNRKLIVGWTGNSDWGQGHFTDMKGVHTIITPAIERLRSEGQEIDAYFADRKDKWRSREEMREYYSNIDVLVCASEFEGTPNPVLEAMACGVPVVSTRVGIVEMALTGPQRPFILEQRSADALTAALRQMLEQRSLLAELSAHNIRESANWSWEHKIANWRQLFTQAAHDYNKLPHSRSYLLARQLNDARQLDNLRSNTKKQNERINTLREKLSKNSGANTQQLAASQKKLEAAERRIENLLSALENNRSARINYQSRLERLMAANSESHQTQRSA